MASHWASDYILFPLLLPFIAIWLLLARIISTASPLLVIPSLILAKRLNWAVPIGKLVWQKSGKLRGTLSRLGFEATYCQNVVRRFLTLPLRPYTPNVYILGFPKCGTTAMAAALLKHPAVAGLDGLRWHPVLSKESHFFNGVLGRNSASSPTLYRSFFPTVLTRWWREAIRRSGGFFCIDACPLTGCLPYTAKRIASINPDAKLVFMVRDPVDAVFSAEIMFRNLGFDLGWSFMEDVIAADPRFAESSEDAHFWEQLEDLEPEDPLPVELPDMIFGKCSMILRCASYAERVRPFLEIFPRQNVLFVELSEFRAKPEETVAAVLTFIGADPSRAKCSPPPMVSGDHRGRRMHPVVRRKLQHHFATQNQKLFAIVGREYPWGEWAPSTAADEEEGGGTLPLVQIPVIHAGSGGKAREVPQQKKLIKAAPPGKKSVVELLPGAGIVMKHDSIDRKDSGLVKRVISVSARV